MQAHRKRVLRRIAEPAHSSSARITFGIPLALRAISLSTAKQTKSWNADQLKFAGDRIAPWAITDTTTQRASVTGTAAR